MRILVSTVVVGVVEFLSMARDPRLVHIKVKDMEGVLHYIWKMGIISMMDFLELFLLR